VLPTKLASLPELELKVQFVIRCVQLAPNKMRTKMVTSEETANSRENLEHPEEIKVIMNHL
jgi:hypothetical protein